MQESQLFPTDEAHLVAAVAVRRDVQTVAAATAEPPRLAEAARAARLALVVLDATGMGADPVVIYRRLLEAVVTVEHVAINLRIAYPDMELAA
jgi:hypothetical protein